MLRLGTVVLGADDVGRACAFWAGVLGYDVVTFPDAADDFTILVPPDRVGTRVAVHRSVTPAQDRPRVHLDLVVDNAAEQSSEVDRLVGLGATRVDWEYADHPDFVVLAEPRATASASSTPVTDHGHATRGAGDDRTSGALRGALRRC